LDYVVNHLRADDSSAFVFTNRRKLSFEMVAGLEEKLDKHSVAGDVLHIHGRLKREDKGNLINLFTSKLRIDDFNPNVLIATSAADLGIDHPNAQLQLNVEWPESIASLVQRRGRGSRRGEDSKYVLVAGISSYVHIVKRNMAVMDVATDEEPADTTTPESRGYNNTITTSTSKKSTSQLKRDKDYALSKTQQQYLVVKQNNDIRNVLDLYCLDRGCVQRRIQMYLSGSDFKHLPDECLPCGNACPICTGQWKHYFLPVRKDGILAFFQNSDDLPCEATAVKLIGTVWKNDHWIKAIFDLAPGSVCKYNVEAMFLQLIATRLLSIVCINGNFKWIKTRETSSTKAYPPFLYTNDSNWNGVNLIDPTKNRRHNVLK